MLVQAQSTEKNRILKLVETMGIKLAAVASDMFGASGMAMLRPSPKAPWGPSNCPARALGSTPEVA